MISEVPWGKIGIVPAADICIDDGVDQCTFCRICKMQAAKISPPTMLRLPGPSSLVINSSLTDESRDEVMELHPLTCDV